MKYAFSNLGCPSWTVEQAATAAGRWGYDAIELRLLDGDVIDPAADAAKLRRAVTAARSQGVEICGFDTSCRLSHLDPAERRRQREELLRWIDLAGELEVRVARVFGGHVEPGDGAEPGDEQINALVAEGLAEAAPWAEAAGVTVALETHDAFSSARRVAEVLRVVESPYVGALWDSHHPYRMGESVQKVFTLLGGRLAHVHVKDARRTGQDGSAWELVLLGWGEVPVAEMLRTLEVGGYAGYIAVEWEKKWHPEIAEPEVALPQHIAWLKSGRSELPVP